MAERPDCAYQSPMGFLSSKTFSKCTTDRFMILRKVTSLFRDTLNLSTLLALTSITQHRLATHHRLSLQQVNVNLSDGISVTYSGKLLIPFL